MSLESVFKLSLVMNMIDHLSGPMAQIASRVGADVSRMDALSQTFGGMAKAGTVMQEMGTQVVGAVLEPVTATFETRRALGELASLGVKDLDALENAARSFSDQWSGTSKADFISAAYDIKSGISSLTDEGVAEYTSLSGLTAKATKSTVGEMTSLFATGYGIYKNYYSDLSDIEFGEMFSAGISESVRAFKTSGSGMAQSIQSLGASATTANVPMEEQLAVLGMLQATMGGSEAGTKYKAFLRSAAKGGQALGLSFLDANNQLLSMPEIIELLRSKFGETMDAAEKMQLQQAFGDTEAVALIDLMYSKTGDLQNNILNLYDAMGKGTGVAEQMASAMQETEPERFERLQQRIHNVTESIGNTLLPTINDFMGKGEAVLTKVGSWIEQNQELVRMIMIVVLALGGFLTVAGTVITVISAIGLIVTKTISAFKILKAGFVLAKGALAPLISSVWSFTAALLANLVTWIVIGIVALIAALVLLYNQCEWFRNGVNAIFSFFKEKLSAALQVAGAVFQGIGDVIGTVMGAAKETVAQNLSNMQSAYEAHGGGIQGIAAAAVEGVKGFYNAGFTFLDNLTGGKLTEIKDKFSEKLAPISNVVGAVMDAASATMSEKLGNMQAAYEAHGGGIQGIAAAAVEGVRGFYSAGFTFLDNLTGGKLTEIKDKFSEKLAPISNAVGAVMDAAAATVSEKLGNMQAAYEAHGGGIQGIAAAAVEGVKGYYTAGFTFLDNLSGGKLTEIRDKFQTSLSGLGESVSQKFVEVHTAFTNGLNNIKSSIDAAKEWFFTSGKRIVSTFASGIQSAFSEAVEAVKGGLQRIRNMLPFSDAKEGPLSTLTLSGKRTMTTYAHGLTLAQNAPAEAMEKGLTRTKATLEREPVRKVNLKASSENQDEHLADSESGNETDGKTVIIQKLIMPVDLKKIKDLQTLLSIIKEIEDVTNGNGAEDPSWDADILSEPV